jgi:hypothetical protein
MIDNPECPQPPANNAPDARVLEAKKLELMKEACQPAANILGGSPATAPDPFDLRSAIVNQDYLKRAASSEVEQALKIRPPNKREFFRAFPHYVPFNLYVNDVPGSFDKAYYIIMPAMSDLMEDESFEAALVLCVTKDGLAFFWPLRVPSYGANAWAESGWEAVKTAHETWVRIVSDRNKGGSGYRIKKAQGDFGKPEFPATDEEGYLRLLELAVPAATHRIASKDHPVFKREIEGRP